MTFYPYIIAFAAAAYLLGSIPSAVWIGRRFYGIDVRQHGSRNAGTTNALRVLGWRAALPVLLADVLKGFAAAALAYFIPPAFAAQNAELFCIIQMLYGLLAIVGHMYPVFAGFRGGKGVATTLGVAVAVCPVPTAAAAAVFVVIFMASRIVSVGSLSAGVAFPLVVIFVSKEPTLAVRGFAVLVCLLLFYTHRKNIRRLLNGTEPRTAFNK